MAKRVSHKKKTKTTPVKRPALSYEEVVHLAIVQHMDELKKLPGFIDMHVGLSSNPHTPEQICVVINSRFDMSGDYPAQLKVKLPNGKTEKVNVEVVTGFSIPKAHASAGDSICLGATAYLRGTLGGIIQRNSGTQTLWLTCSHVLTGGDPVDKGGDLPAEEQQEVQAPSEDFTPIGKWCYALLNNRFDIALINPSGYENPGPNDFSTSAIPYNNSFIGRTVFINGAVNKAEGFIVGQSNAAIDFDYNSQLHSLVNLIKISRYQYLQQSLTIGGDSGAMAYLSDTKEPLGMVVGANEQYTFLIPITDILEQIHASF